MKKKLLLLVLLFFIAPCCAEEIVPRTVAAFYDGKTFSDYSETAIHNYAEEPLNHLGIQLIYYDINEKLPDLKERDDILGVVTWFKDEHYGRDNTKFLEWSIEMLDADKTFVVIGFPGFELNALNDLSLEDKNRFWNKIGMHDFENWITDTYMVTYEVLSPNMVNFERDINSINTQFQIKKVAAPDVRSHAKGKWKNDEAKESDLIVTGPKGSFIAHEYGLFTYYSDLTDEKRLWCVNPYEFFRLAFQTDSIPKLDPTTLAGRRIYFSHIDGDGWNNYPQNTQFKEEKRPKIASETVYRKVIAPFPDLPVTVGAIGAELDKEWIGDKESERIARLIYALPQVEVASHTLSHPFQWKWFDENEPSSEVQYLKEFPKERWDKNPKFKQFLPETDQIQLATLKTGYDVPRGFASKPFNIEDEILTSLSIVDRYSPKGKKAEMILWSGDCVPFEEAVALSRKAGRKNMNGGDARFDFIHPSYAYVPPFGRRVGKELQIYCAGSNENTYTDLWTAKFWAFATVPETFMNTEMPIRVLPMNLYYHMYCSEKDAPLAALLKNIHYVRSKEICPITASNYAKCAEGFFFGDIVKLGERKWKIKNRKSLQTIRFDKATALSIDFEESDGVIGQRHYQGSLYIYLDASIDEPVIALKDAWGLDREPVEDIPYLVQGRWQVWDLNRKVKGSLSMKVKGFGKGEMVWQVNREGEYKISAGDNSITARTKDGMLPFILESDAINELELTIRYKDGS